MTPSLDLDLDPYFFKKSKLNLTGQFQVDGHLVSAEQVISALQPLLTEERTGRIDQVVSQRSFSLVPVLENIYDRGNISAVMRSAEAFGFFKMHIIEPEQAAFKAANRVTKGADKWLDVAHYQKASESIGLLKKQGYQVFATHLTASRPIDEIDFTKKTAIVLGNEKDGVSEEMQQLCDGNVVIPMLGFSQSFNISVAAALIFYHVYMFRKQKLGLSGDLTIDEQTMVRANYYLRCFDNPEGVLKKALQP